MSCPGEEDLRDLAPFSQEIHELSAKTLTVKVLRKANLSTTGTQFRYLRIARKLEKLRRMKKSCKKYEKLLRSCQATCGKP